MRRILIAAATGLMTSPAAALFFDAGAKQTLGSEHYAGTSVFADFGEDFHLKPSYSQYRSDVSSGTFKTISARLAYDEKLWGAGFTVGGSPKVNGYGNSFFGFDGTLSLRPGSSGPEKRIRGSQEGSGKAKGRGIARVDLGLAFLHTSHHDDLTAARARRAKALTIGQTDVTFSGGVSALDNLLSLDVTKTSYDKDLSSLQARGAEIVALTGLNAVIQGFPKSSVSARYEMGWWPLVTPYASYTHTTFELAQPASSAYTAGAYLELEIVELNASYQRYAQSGQSDRNYVTFGATLRF